MGTKNICQVAVNYALSKFLMIYLQEKGMLQKTVSAYKNRSFVPLDPGKTKSNLQFFEGIVNDSLKGFIAKFKNWFKQQYQFDLYSQNQASAFRRLSIEQKFEQARALLYNVDESVYKFNNKQAFRLLQSELDSLQREYGKLPPATNRYFKNTPANMVQQSQQISPEEITRNEIEKRLLEFEKKLRKLIFDNTHKTAN